MLLWMLDVSLTSDEGFETVKVVLDNSWVKITVFSILAALLYHLLAGIRHLIMDMGVGESLEGGKKGAALVMGATIVGLVFLGAWIW